VARACKSITLQAYAPEMQEKAKQMQGICRKMQEICRKMQTYAETSNQKCRKI